MTNEQRIAYLEAELDTARRIPLGRYAFYHRHLAMGYVRRANPELANEASVWAGHEIDEDGGVSYQDVVSELVEACKAALARIESDISDTCPEALQLRAALAKAGAE